MNIHTMPDNKGNKGTLKANRHHMSFLFHELAGQLTKTKYGLVWIGLKSRLYPIYHS